MHRFASLLVPSLLVALAAAPAWAVEKLNDCAMITDPGSYQLTKDVTAAGDCFVLDSPQITLDLGGHAIIGDGTGAAIGGFAFDSVIANGRIRDFASGVSLAISQGVQVRDLTIEGTTGTGIAVGNHSTVTGNVLRGIGGVGIQVSSTSVIRGNTVDTIGAAGAEGIVDGGGLSVIESNTVTSSSDDALVTATVGTVVRSNTLSGFSARAGVKGRESIVKDNTIFAGQVGVEMTCPANVSGNVIKILAAPGTEIVTAGAGCVVVENAF